jgi:uncharacterized protein YhjY with autotransporter beta-barrel domain
LAGVGGTVGSGSGGYITIGNGSGGITPPSIDPAFQGGNISISGSALNPMLLITDQNSVQLASVNLLMSSSLTTVLSGSHHRTLLDNGIAQEDGAGFWATGDIARHDTNHSNVSVGEMGVYQDVVPGVRIGVSVGVNQNRQVMPLGGSGKSDANYLVLEGDYQLADSPMSESVTLYLGSNQASISRGYLIGMTQNLSSGQARGSSWALRLRSDWHNITTMGGLEASPYVSYTHGESRLEGYAETGGANPIVYGVQQQNSDEVRAGVTVSSKISEQTDLRVPIELAYRTNPANTVTAIGVGTQYSFSNASISQSWGRIGVEIDQHLNKQTLVNGGLLVAGRGGDSTWLGTVSMKTAF